MTLSDTVLEIFIGRFSVFTLLSTILLSASTHSKILIKQKLRIKYIL